MSLNLHNLESPTRNKKKKRVGRGNASGHGTYSGRGVKGQRSRSGGKRKAGARSPFLRQLPKLKGFKSKKPKASVVNLGTLNNRFESGSEVNPKTLLRAGLIDNIKTEVKILGQGELKLENLKVFGCKVSKSAVGQIEKMKGEIFKN